MKALKIIAAIVLVFLAGYAIDWFASREERAIMRPIREAAEAIEKHDWSKLESALDPEFSYGSSMPWIGEGTAEAMRGKLVAFWPRTTLFSIILRESKIEAETESATAEISGNVKIVVDGGFGLYKFRAIAQLRQTGNAWKIARVDIPQLEPGF